MQPHFLLSSPGIFAINPTPTVTTGNSVIYETELYITSLQHAIQRYYHMGLAHNTCKSFTTGISHYKGFCTLATKNTLPTTESNSPSFTSYVPRLPKPILLNHKSLSLRSLKSTCHTWPSFPIQLSTQPTSCLQKLNKDIYKQQAIDISPRICHPITIQIMAEIKLF